MKLLVATGVMVAGLTLVAWNTLAVPPQGGAPRSSGFHGATSSGGLIALTGAAGDHRQQLMVVDPELRTIGVYHVDATSGEIVLKSVRNIHWDLQMMEFNGTNPTPREIQTQLQGR